MVSEKVVVVLIIVAILLSIVSVIVTVASVKAPEIQSPKIVVQTGKVIPDADKGQVSLIVNKPTAPVKPAVNQGTK